MGGMIWILSFPLILQTGLEANLSIDKRHLEPIMQEENSWYRSLLGIIREMNDEPEISVDGEEEEYEDGYMDGYEDALEDLGVSELEEYKKMSSADRAKAKKYRRTSAAKKARKKYNKRRAKSSYRPDKTRSKSAKKSAKKRR